MYALVSMKPLESPDGEVEEVCGLYVLRTDTPKPWVVLPSGEAVQVDLSESRYDGLIERLKEGCRLAKIKAVLGRGAPQGEGQDTERPDRLIFKLVSKAVRRGTAAIAVEDKRQFAVLCSLILKVGLVKYGVLSVECDNSLLRIEVKHQRN